MRDWRRLIDELAGWEKQGQTKTAMRALRRVGSVRALPRDHAVTFANLARRLGFPFLAARVLHPIVRRANRSAAPPGDAEIVAYAAALIRIGAPAEALELLRHAVRERTSAALLFTSHALVARWEYRESIAVLAEYLAAPGLTPYESAIGRLNLAAALVHEERFDEAAPQIAALDEEARVHRFLPLRGHCFELSAQLAMGRADWTGARAAIAAARPLLEGQGKLDALFLRKWEAMMSAREKNDLDVLDPIRRAATELRHWETVRDCDLFAALRTRDVGRAVHLYFGTPFESFRRRIFEKWPGPLELPAEYPWFPGESGPVLDVPRRLACARKPVMKRLFEILISDFYRPFRVATIHQQLYPDETFNPASSPARVHSTVRGLRRWLAVGGFPIAIEHGGAGYFIGHGAQCGIAIPKGEVADPIAILRKRFPRDEFSAKEAESVWGRPARSTTRALKAAVEEGLLQRSGSGNRTRYRF